MIELHYAPIDLDATKKDIEKTTLTDFKDLESFNEMLLNKSFFEDSKPKVYLLAIEDAMYEEDQIFVFSDLDCLMPYFSMAEIIEDAENSSNYFEDEEVMIKFFVFELPSFEDAYEMALDMREGESDIVYKNKNNA